MVKFTQEEKNILITMVTNSIPEMGCKCYTCETAKTLLKKVKQLEIEV